MNNNYKYLVCTRCMTYNHEQFIKDAMAGFAMQQTLFPVVTVIVDDASTDGTRDVIKGFLQDNFNMTEPCCYEKDTKDAYTIFTKHSTNVNCYFAVVFLKENLYGKRSKKPFYEKWTDNAKYNAVCEGDDYWTSPDKLQKQVDFLENHPDYSFCFHRYKVYDQENDRWLPDVFESIFQKHPEGLVIGDNNQHVRTGWITQTLTMIYRTDALDEFNRFGYDRSWDFIRLYFLRKNGKGFCFNEKWGVYRKSFSGVHAKQSSNTKNMRKYNAYKALYKFDPNSVSRRLYYNSYASAMLSSKGKLIFSERFEFRKFISLFQYIPLKIFKKVKK